MISVRVGIALPLQVVFCVPCVLRLIERDVVVPDIDVETARTGPIVLDIVGDDRMGI